MSLFSSARLNVLEELYDYYNDVRFVHPDPLEFVLRFPDPASQEVVGLLASSLAYGRVCQILKSVETVLAPMNGEPYKFVMSHNMNDFRKIYVSFKHRFTTGEELALLLSGIRRLLQEYTSLKSAFQIKISPGDDNYLSALCRFTAELFRAGNIGSKNSLVPNPMLGSSCKRLFLFLRWMIRCDNVDPGPWKNLSPKGLLIPLDTHMHAVSREIGLTNSKSPGIKTALEITRALALFSAEDPIKYDFSLTRPGIRREHFVSHFLSAWQ